MRRISVIFLSMFAAVVANAEPENRKGDIVIAYEFAEWEAIRFVSPQAVSPTRIKEDAKGHKFTLGWQAHQNLTVEATYYTSDENEEIRTAMVGIRASSPMTDSLWINAHFGYADTDFKDRNTEEGSAYFGIGLEYWFARNIALTTQWGNYAHGDDNELTGLSFGLRFSFALPKKSGGDDEDGEGDEDDEDEDEDEDEDDEDEDEDEDDEEDEDEDEDDE